MTDDETDTDKSTVQVTAPWWPSWDEHAHIILNMNSFPYAFLSQILIGKIGKINRTEVGYTAVFFPMCDTYNTSGK